MYKRPKLEICKEYSRRGMQKHHAGFAVMQARGDRSLDQGGYSGNGEKG